MRLVLIIAAAVTLLAGCASGPTTSPDSDGGPAPSRQSPPTPGLSPTSTPAPTSATSSEIPLLEWIRLPGSDLENARLEVPQDYDQPAGPSLTIVLGRLRATDPAHRIGSIVLNPGGPGGPGVATLRDNADTLFSPAVRARFDIVSFDPRGIGVSDRRIRCLDRSAQPSQSSEQGEAGLAAAVAAAKAYAAACQANSGDLLPFVGTVDVVRDLDRIRAALGEQTLTYVGQSYGTLIGALYAEQFPARTRAMILDAPLDPALDVTALMSDRASAYQRQLDQFLAWCASDQTCAFWSEGRTRAAFDALMTRFAEGPIGGVSTSQARTGVLVALLWGSRTALAQALDAARRGDATILARLAASVSAPDVVAANTAANCVDWPYPRDVESYVRLAEELRSTAPDFAWGPWGLLSCAFWPVPPSRVPGPVHAEGAPPILIVVSTGDPATPPEWGVALSHELASSVLVTRDDIGHTSLGRADACINGIAERYLLDLEVPVTGQVCP